MKKLTRERQENLDINMNMFFTPEITTPKSFVTLIPTVQSNMKPISGVTDSQNLEFDAVGVEVISTTESPERRVIREYDTLPRNLRDSESENANLRRTIQLTK